MKYFNIIYPDNVPYKKLSRVIELPVRCMIKAKTSSAFLENVPNVKYIIYVRYSDVVFALGWIIPDKEPQFMSNEYNAINRFYLDNPGKIYEQY